MFDEFLDQPINDIVPSGLTHIGFIAGAMDGTFALLRPSKSVVGATPTFAKERILSEELPSQTLRRCISRYEQHAILSVYPVAPVAVTPNSTTFYFAGIISGENPYWKTEKGVFEWNVSERVVSELNTSKSPASKQRDLAVFDAARKICLSPDRRVMLMLRELHRMGFERLRAPSHAWNISWRCFIVPAAWTLKKHGHEFRDPRTTLAPIPALRKSESFDSRCIYGGAQGQRPFGWPDVPFATPRELAHRFLRECPDIAMLGWGPDKEYVEWYERLLDATQPYHLFNTEGDSFYSDRHIFITMDRHFPLPPPGQTDKEEADAFVQRFSPPHEPAE